MKIRPILMVQIHFINIKKISISYGCLVLHKKQQFHFNKQFVVKLAAYSVKLIQAGNPSNKDRQTNTKVIFVSVAS